MVGFELEAKKIMRHLSEETEELDVIPITGLPGVGKTTLAAKIFNDERVLNKFPTRIWAYVSREFRTKNVFLAILKELTTEAEHPVEMYSNKSDHELARLIDANLEKRRFLIVMDDVWRAEDWDKLRIAFPKRNKTGKVLITSRNEQVARYANHDRLPHKLHLLDQDDSWLLLRSEVFRKRQCPPELEALGQLVAEKCGGLPLAIVVIGDIIVRMFSTTSNEVIGNKNEWKKVSESLSTYLKEHDPERRVEKSIALSYNDLPYHLRPCFLYFGMFREDLKIPVWKLIRMWIAEGFIQHKIGFSLEETAESYLKDLIDRNLVRIDKIKPDGTIKTCHVHGMLRDFCRNEAGNESENFFQEMSKSVEGFFESPAPHAQKCRRLCIHSDVLDFISSSPCGSRVRSFVCFSKEQVDLPRDRISIIPTAFKLLRVLDVKPIKFPEIPSDMYSLFHLRYIHLSLNSAILPKAFRKLWNIQTLIVDTTSRTLNIKANIWKMMQLRHLKTNASASLPKTGKSSIGGEKLQTLGTISPQSCTKEVVDRALNLKKLGIRGQLALLLDGSFESLRELKNLEKLKLLNDVSPNPPSGTPLSGLPQHYNFPPNLRRLTLSQTFLSWGASHMTTLGLLENLEVLKLKDNAFTGRSWTAPDHMFFGRLEVLHIGRTDLAVWIASCHNFPALRRLELHNCEELKLVPVGLAHISSLQQLDLYHSSFAAESAKKIQKAREKKQAEETTNFNVLKLNIYPTDGKE